MMKKAICTAGFSALFATAAAAAPGHYDYNKKIDQQPRAVTLSHFSSAAVDTSIKIFMGYNLTLSAEHRTCTRDGYLVSKKTAFEVPLNPENAEKLTYDKLQKITYIYRSTVGPHEDHDLELAGKTMTGAEVQKSIKETGAPAPGERMKEDYTLDLSYGESNAANINMWRQVEEELGFRFNTSGGKWTSSQYSVSPAPILCPVR